MAWTEKRGDGYRAGWRDGNQQRRYKSGFRNQKAAMNYAVNEEQSSQGTSTGDAKATFGYWLDRWLKIRNVEASTDKRDRERIEIHVRPQWGAVPVRKITKLSAEEWVSELDELVSPWTVRRIWYNFATPLRWAHERGARLVTPCPYVLGKGTLPTPAPGHERYLPWDKLDPLVIELGDERLPALLLFGTGMRWGEMAGLHREKIDLDRQIVHILETWDRDAKAIKGYPKSKQARDVPLPDWLCDELEAHFSTVPDLGSCGVPHAAGTPCTSSLAVTGEKLGPLNREHYASDVLKPALARIGVTGLRIHDSRHTYASWLLQAGRSIAEVSELLGHHSVVVTMKYSHLDGTHWAGVRDALSRGRSLPALPPRGQKGDNDTLSDLETAGHRLTLVS